VGKSIAPHIQGDPSDNLGMSLHTVDPRPRLHFAVARVPAFDSVGGRGQQTVIQKSQGLVNIGREEHLQGLAQVGKALNALA